MRLVERDAVKQGVIDGALLFFLLYLGLVIITGSLVI